MIGEGNREATGGKWMKLSRVFVWKVKAGRQSFIGSWIDVEKNESSLRSDGRYCSERKAT